MTWFYIQHSLEQYTEIRGTTFTNLYSR